MLYVSPRADVFQFSMMGILVSSKLSLLVFWRRALLHWFSAVLAWVELCLPCQGRGPSISSSGLHYVVLFWSLKAFSTDGGMKMALPQSLTLEVKVHTSDSSVSPHRKVLNHSYLPGFQPNSVFTQAVIEQFNVRHTAQFEVSKLRDSCSTDLCHSSQWREGCLTVLLPVQQFTVHGNTEKKARA